MAVRAKFRCDSNQSDGNEGRVVAFSAVVGEPDGPNAAWSKWTPSGSLQMSITNPDAFNQFEADKEYFLDFTPAVAAE